MTAQPVQVLSVLAAAPVYNAAALSDTVAVQPTSRYIVHVKNGSGSAITVTFDDQATPGPAQAQSFNPDVQFSVPATSERIILIDSTRFRDILGNLNIAFSAITTVTYAIYGPL
jgi:hypothetical protein